jgi:hypothetical protein
MQTIDVMKNAVGLLRYARSVASFERNDEMDACIADLDQAIKQEALQAMHDNAREIGLDYEPVPSQYGSPELQAMIVAHCEAGPEYCQQCHLEDRSLALASAVRYVKNNTPKLVSDEIHMALSTPPATVQPLAILNHAHGVYAFRSVNLQGLPDGEYQVYTTAPAAQKPWIGLTDEDVAVVLTGDSSLSTRLDELTPSWVDLVRAVEAKLKALNYPTGNYPIVDN